ncbi:trypsin-like serine peptidase [Thermostaphylospora chromogena]|uniref:Trypsin n=1 Tax=Thermostaphylospora chromogena TaxID=35622 RepID=A0A1H1ANQ2_9ACTN|nr:hypothetical protein [Thermostaphylospora chromogena]SDQ40806.1 hypothetical protein SAMN04489764_0562 [Thermostaphylospora chromogena]
MNTRAKRLVLPMGGALVATSVIGASMATSAEAEPTRKTITLAASAADAKAIAGSWTSSKLKSAKYYTADSGATGGKKSSRKASADGKAGKINPTGRGGKSYGKSKNVNLPVTLGRVFFEVDGKAYYCSGTAVQSKFRNLVATAGHCVYDTEKNKPVDNFVFIPGYYQGKAPWGIYVGAKMHTHYDFDVYEDYDRDYAFVNVYNGIKQAPPKEVSKDVYDKWNGPKWTDRKEITRQEYRKCVLNLGSCYAEGKNSKAEEVGPDYPGAVLDKKEVTEREYRRAKVGKGQGYKYGEPVVEHVTKNEYDAYKGPGTKKKDARGNYTITHYYVQRWIKPGTVRKYYRETYWIAEVKDVGRLGDNVGGQGFAWNQKLGKKVFVFGYPTGPHADGNKAYTGETPKWCYGKTYAGPAVPKYKVEEGVAVKCAFTPGSSGGPLLWMYKSAKRTGYLNGVVSLVLDTDGNKRYDRISSPYFDGETYSIYKHAANLWTGKLGS